jgi:4-azaleucine resistance transporter AzlC
MAQAVTLSVFTFAGSSQFAYVSVISGGGNPATAVGGALLLAARNALYGPVVTPVLREGAFRRAVAAQFLTDETTAMASAQDEPNTARDAFWFTGLAIMSLWVAGTVAGVLLGGNLEDPGAWGLDAAFPAAFVALLVPHVGTRAGKVTALVGAVIALVSVPITPAGAPILMAALAVGPGMAVASWRRSP